METEIDSPSTPPSPDRPLRSGIRGALGTPSYALFLGGHILSANGMWMQRIGLGWLAWQLTESAAWLGAMTFLQLMPVLLFGLVGGVLADRMSPIGVMMVHQSALTLAAAALALLVGAGMADVMLLAGFALSIGVLKGLCHASEKAMIYRVLPRDLLPAGISLYAVGTNLAGFTGPALAGALILWGDMAMIFACAAALYLCFLLVLVVLRGRIASRPREKTAPRRIHQDLGAGIAYVARHPGIGPILCLHIGFSMLHRPLIDMMPGISAELFGQGADGLAALTSAVGLGAVLGGLWLAWRNLGRGLTRLVMRAALLLGVAILIFVNAPNLSLALPCAALIGACLLIRAAATQTLIQLAVDQAMRGRTMSLYIVATNGAGALGALCIGAAADLVGFRWSIATAVLLAMSLVFVIMRRREHIERSLEAGAPTDRMRS